MFKSIATIAINTFKETIRDKVLYVIFICSFLLAIVSLVLGTISVGNNDKIALDFGLAGVNILGTIIAIFLGTSLVFKEIEHKTIYMIITKPIERYEFILGKYIGLISTLIMSVMVMSTVFLFVICLYESNITKVPIIMLSIYMMILELLVITSVAMLFSTFSNHLLSMVLTYCVWIIGHLNPLMFSLTQYIDSQSMYVMVEIIHRVMPDFSAFNVKNMVNVPHSIHFINIAISSIYGLSYAGVIILLSIFSINRKEFI